jgi:hypothetical protein
MGTIQGGEPVTHAIPDKKPVASPHGDGGHKPQASARPETGRPYASTTKPPDNYSARTESMRKHRTSLSAPRTDR